MRPLTTTRIATDNECNHRPIQTLFQLAPWLNAEMDPTALVGTIKEHVHTTEVSLSGSTSDLIFNGGYFSQNDHTDKGWQNETTEHGSELDSTILRCL